MSSYDFPPSEPAPFDTVPPHSACAADGATGRVDSRPEATAVPALKGDALQAWSRLRRMHGPGEQRVVLLALLITPGSGRERLAWEEETRDVLTAAHGLRQVERLPASARLPVLEAVLATCANLPLAQRRGLIQAARRLMCADGRVGALDRLVLLLVRHRLKGLSAVHRGGARDSAGLSGLPLGLRQAIATLSAYLARLVPASDSVAVVGAAGAAWHRAVVESIWGNAPHPPACNVPDADGLVRSLQLLQELGWMRRPMLARVWMDALASLQLPDAGTGKLGPPPLSLTGAEALRIACGLLDTPVPPDLLRRFSELPAQH